MARLRILLYGAIYALVLVGSSLAQSWCGKNYMEGSPVFPVPQSSEEPLLAFKCSQAVLPYIAGDSGAQIIVDTSVVYSFINGASPISLSQDPSENVSISISAGGIELAAAAVSLNTAKNLVSFNLSQLNARAEPYNLSCDASYASQSFHANSTLTYLPTLPDDIGSVAKLDLRTGVMLVQPADGSGGEFTPIIPFGFYTSFDGFLATNLSIPAEIKARGFNMIHVVPGGTTIDEETLGQVLDAMQAAGLYYVHDMRYAYTNQTAVTDQVNFIKARPNLLVWYTADEPDGSEDALNATSIARALITSLDGGTYSGTGTGYHPVSLVLNCQNYYFSDYAAGADIVAEDVYMIDINATYSIVWDTVCTRDYGDCGCDNCIGAFVDIARRVDEFRARFVADGWVKTVWGVPQAFGNATYWPRYPTGAEFVVQSIVSLNHGARGIMPWIDGPSTPSDILSSASDLANALVAITSFIADPAATVGQYTSVDGVDVGIWQAGERALVLAANTNYAPASLSVYDLGLSVVTEPVQILDSGAYSNTDTLVFDSVGAGIFVYDL
ncbi:hypothetical protein FISHEDRAFT_65755 [Fistulina hepatica ATCC 64428]|uniref:Glycoside hydrolase n=1 Tax=Fistulina hepatica ATCC 64428 TaxID=1128425 RepID=A0A0D7AF27_9AGAR|nr:hypothetical protein FISHEDRAFT_65755 [Fistulina hepatica ATCC 64428]